MTGRFWVSLILPVIGAGQNIVTAQPLPIRVGYTSLTASHTPLWIGKESDIFERHGIQSSPIYMAATIAFRAMLAGETDFTVGAGLSPIQARLAGADPLILLTYISRFPFSIMARPPIGQPGDLRGKRLGVSRFGAPSDFGARIALKRWGLVPVKDAAIIQLGGNPEAFAALKAGAVQAAVLGPPFSTEAKREGMLELFDFNQSDVEFPAIVLNSTARYVSAHGEATRRLVRAFVEGIWAFKGDREASLRALQKYTRLSDRTVLEETYQSARKVVRLLPRTTDAAVRNILEALGDQNPRAPAANPQDFYTNRFVDELEQNGFLRELAARYPGALR
jgi:ABC-type nitrate/sulfonate/bicarbonate transport system substrate-binding protein